VVAGALVVVIVLALYALLLRDRLVAGYWAWRLEGASGAEAWALAEKLHAVGSLRVVEFYVARSRDAEDWDERVRAARALAECATPAALAALVVLEHPDVTACRNRGDARPAPGLSHAVFVFDLLPDALPDAEVHRDAFLRFVCATTGEDSWCGGGRIVFSSASRLEAMVPGLLVGPLAEVVGSCRFVRSLLRARAESALAVLDGLGEDVRVDPLVRARARMEAAALRLPRFEREAIEPPK